MITDQSLPLRLLPEVARSLDDIIVDIRSANDQAVETVTAVRADADEKIHALEITAARLAEELHESRQAGLNLQMENCALIAAAFVLAADGIRREEELQAELRKAAGKAAAQVRIITGLEGLLDDYYGAERRHCEHIARLVEELRRARVEADAGAERAGVKERRRFPRKR